MAICPGCGGDGIYGEGLSASPCGVCHGTGAYEPNEAHTVLLKHVSAVGNIFTNLSPTCKVASCINSTEYLALVDAAKDRVKIVLSCGFVDMREEQWARTMLWTVFGEASVTRAALIAMFG